MTLRILYIHFFCTESNTLTLLYCTYHDDQIINSVIFYFITAIPFPYCMYHDDNHINQYYNYTFHQKSDIRQN